MFLNVTKICRIMGRGAKWEVKFDKLKILLYKYCVGRRMSNFRELRFHLLFERHILRFRFRFTCKIEYTSSLNNFANTGERETREKGRSNIKVNAKWNIRLRVIKFPFSLRRSLSTIIFSYLEQRCNEWAIARWSSNKRERTERNKSIFYALLTITRVK